MTLSVHGKFLDKKKARVNEASFATMGGKTALLDQLNELALNSKMAGGPNPIAVLNLVDIVAKDLQKKETPEAYLIYALYDEDSNRYEVGKKVLTRNAANQHEELEEKIAIKKNGYIETFVVNETTQDVWFDNFKILSQGSILVQETHYDPWGSELTGIGYEYAGVKKNKYLYQGKEMMDDQNLNIYDFHARGYDPVIGRTWQLDPHSDNYYDFSPFSWVANNPIGHIDPDGKDVYVIIDGVARLAKKQDGNHTFIDNETGKDIDPFGKDWSIVASALNNAGRDVMEGLGDSDYSKSLRKQVGLYNSMQIKNTFNDNVDLITAIGGIRSLYKNGLAWWAKHFGDDAIIAIPQNRLHHIFEKSEHALGLLVSKFGSKEAAYMAVQKAANQALKAGKLSPNSQGILPKVGEVLVVGGIKVRLIGGKVENGKVIISSFSRQGL